MNGRRADRRPPRPHGGRQPAAVHRGRRGRDAGSVAAFEYGVAGPRARASSVTTWLAHDARLGNTESGKADKGRPAPARLRRTASTSVEVTLPYQVRDREYLGPADGLEGEAVAEYLWNPVLVFLSKHDAVGRENIEILARQSH